MKEQLHRTAQDIVALATQKKLTICSVESITGGRISAEITSISGASTPFFAGGVFYDKRAKEDILGISTETIKKYGVYSTECASAMAQCWREKCKADICVSTTGRAEAVSNILPEVFFGISTRFGEKTTHKTFSGTRTEVQEQATLFALILLKEEIETLKA